VQRFGSLHEPSGVDANTYLAVRADDSLLCFKQADRLLEFEAAPRTLKMNNICVDSVHTESHNTLSIEMIAIYRASLL
jgi:hypothetical protein